MSSSYRRYAPKRDEIPSTSSSTATTRRNLSATGEPSTTGTSWASLRFNKPMTDGFRGHSSRLASTFEPSRTTASTYAPSTASLSSRYSTTSSTAKEKPSAGYVRSALANYQKAVASSERSTRPKATVAGPLMTYRSQVARDMFSPTRFVPSSHTTTYSESTTAGPTRSALANSYLSRTKSPPSNSSYLSSRTKSPPSRSIFSPARVAPEPDNTYSNNRSLSAGRPYSFSPASSTASYHTQPLSRVTSSSLVANPPRRPVSSSYESDNLSLAVTKALSRPTPKADRPWRQKMADAARIRNIHGDDIPSSIVSRLTATRASRRNSIGQNSGDELQNSLNALKSFVADPSATDRNSAISKYRAKNGNPMDVMKSDPRPTAGFTNGPPILPGSMKPYRTSGYGKTLTEAQMSESYAGTPSSRLSSIAPTTAMSRSYSPNRSGSTLFENISPRTSYRYPSHESIYHPPPPAPLFRDKGQTIIEEIQERWGESSSRRRHPPRSSKERTARHNSRQRSLSKEPAKSSSSSEGEEGSPKKRRESRDPPKKRRIRKRTSSIPKKQEEKLPPTVMLTDEKNITQEALQSPQPQPPLPTVSIDLAPSTTSSIKTSKGAATTAATTTQSAAAGIRASASGSSIGLVTAATGGVVGSGGGSNTSLNIKTEEEFKSAQSSPQISPMGNKSTKSSSFSPAASTAAAPPSGVPKSQPEQPQPQQAVAQPAAQPPIQKPPSALQRVLAPFRRKQSKTAIKAAPGESEKPQSPPTTSSASTTAASTKAAPVAQEETISVSESISEATTTTAPTSTYIEEDETKYNAIAEFKPGKSRKNVVQVKAQKPVPGLWQGTTNEINISCNRNLTRKVISHLAVEALLRDQVFSKAVPKRFKQPIIKKKKHTIVEKSLEVVLVGHPLGPPKEKVFKTIQLKRPLLVYRVEAKFAEPSTKKPTKVKPIPVSALAVLNQEILNKKRAALGCDKILKAARAGQKGIKLNCKSSKEIIKNVDINIRRKEEKRAANVTVIAVDVMDVNWAKASKKLKAIIDPLKKNLAEIIEQQAAIIEAEKERLSRTPRLEDDEISSCSEKKHRQIIETQASIVLSGLRNAEPGFFSSTASSSLTLTDYSSHLPFDQDYIPGEPLILPDKSILEEYVHRKRNELERLYSEPLRSPSRGGASPCLSTTSELVPACAVRIIEPRNRGAGIAFISAPNRSTIDSIESHSLPTSNRNSKMIEVISYPPSFDPSNNNNNNSSNNNGGGVGWRSALRKPVIKREALTIQHFDAPKTPFEAAMQNQAAQMAKKSSVASNLSALSEGDAQDTSLAEPLEHISQQLQTHRRRPSIESTQSMPPIATGTVGQSFAQAAALASQPRHERYAAHIPVRQTSTEPSGRQSTTSIDSANSGVLDTASRQLDQMIDQARYRHHQHRSKFKEAIDYLDQIFEDLKKEVEPPTSISSEHKTEIPPPQSSRGIQAAKAIFQKQQPAASTVVPHQPQQQPSIVSAGPQANNVPIVRLRKPSELALRQQQQNQQTHHQQHPAGGAILHQPQPIRNGFAPTTSGGTAVPKIGYPTPLRHPASVFQSQPSTSTNIISNSAAPLSSTANNAAATNANGNIGGPGPKPFPKIESGDVEISETIVLPSKGNPEKMNFTRQWLAGDIKSWAEKPDLIVPSGGDLTSPNDSDDRSIGSCSAEVAAINALDRKKKRQVRETPDIIKSSKTSANNNNNNNKNVVHPTKSKQPIQHPQVPQQQQHQQQPMAMPAPQPLRPQPLRPQPQYAPFPINGQLSTAEPSGLQKAPSHEYVMAIQRAHQERAGSQDYQSLGSVHSQDGYKPLSTLSLYSNSLNRSGAFQQYPQRGSIHSLPDASLTTSSLLSRHQQIQPTNYAIQQDPILAMDALVAELELNTDLDRNGEKRRSFPTGYGSSGIGNGNGQNSMHRNFRPLASTTVTSTAPTTTAPGMIPRHGSLNIKSQNSNNGGSMDRGLRRMQIQQRSSLDEMANMLTNVAGDLKPATKPISNGHSQQQQQPHQHQHQQQNAMAQPLKKFALKSTAPEMATTTNNKIGFSPFETINQERFAPSRVGAMQQMFETKKQQTNNGNENGWRKAAPSKSTSKEEENYYEIQEYSQSKIDRPSPMSARHQGASPLTPSRQPSFTGSYNSYPYPHSHSQHHHPHPQPPSVPPPPVSSCVSSANSSQHGYYSSSTSSMGRSNGTQSRELPSSSSTNGPQRRGSFIGKHSLSSRAQSFDDDEDDGFYDNIQVDDRRFSEADNASILSHQLPPTQKGTGRLGQLIRRIGGGGGSRPHSGNVNGGSSSMSLNKMGIDGGISNGSSSTPGHHPLMKSNSLSNEPWRTQIIEGDKRASHPGIGYRLKQTIFGGSKKRLN